MMAAQPKIGQPNDTGLGELLEKYGFKIGQDFVLDTPNVPGPVDLPDGRKMLANVPVYVAVKVPEDEGPVGAGPASRRWCSRSPARSSWSARWPAASPQNGKLWTIAQDDRQTPGSRRGCSSSRPTTKIEEGKEKGSFGLAYAYQGPLKSAYPSPAAARRACRRPTGQRAAVGVEEAGAAARGRRLGLRVRGVPADRPLPPDLLRRARRCCSTPSAGRPRTRR